MNSVLEALKKNPVWDTPRFRAADYVTRRESLMSLIEDTHELKLGMHNQGLYLSVPVDNPEVQPAISCGTSGCVAGWAVLAFGGKPVVPKWALEDAKEFGKETVIVTSAEVDGRTDYIDYLAREILGLNEIQAERLFFYANTVEDLRRMVDILAQDDTNELGEFRPSWMRGYANWDAYQGGDWDDEDED